MQQRRLGDLSLTAEGLDKLGEMSLKPLDLLPHKLLKSLLGTSSGAQHFPQGGRHYFVCWTEKFSTHVNNKQCSISYYYT